MLLTFQSDRSPIAVRSQSDRSPIASDLLKALFNRGRLEVTPHSANGLLTPPYSLRRDGLARWLARDLTSGPPHARFNRDFVVPRLA